MNGGYIKLWRKIRSNPLWKKKRVFSDFEAWIDIIMQANGIDKTVSFRDEYIDIKRGSFITSEYKLAENWGWSRKKVRRFLKYGTEKGMIADQKRYHRYTLITVMNYATYNPVGTTEDTTEELQRIPQRNLTKERERKVMKEKVKKRPTKFSDTQFGLAELLKQKIEERLPKHSFKGNNYLESWANEFRLMVKDKVKEEEIKDVICWIFDKSDFWYKNILSAQTLRKQFGRLWEDAHEEIEGDKQHQEWLKRED